MCCTNKKNKTLFTRRPNEWDRVKQRVHQNNNTTTVKQLHNESSFSAKVIDNKVTSEYGNKKPEKVDNSTVIKEVINRKLKLKEINNAIDLLDRFTCF